MRKRTIARWWIAGIISIGLAAVLIIADAAALLAHHDGLPAAGAAGYFSDDFSRMSAALIGLGVLFALVGLVAEYVAWAAALANAEASHEGRWFRSLLWAGVIGTVTLPLGGLGAVIGGSAVIAYLVGGPDMVPDGQDGEDVAVVAWPKPRILRWSDAGVLTLLIGGAAALLVPAQTGPGGLLHGHTWTALVLVTAATVVVVVGAIVASVSWWASLFNTRLLSDKLWFSVLLATGIVAVLTMPLLGLGALVAAVVGTAYRLRAPDGTTGLSLQAIASSQVHRPAVGPARS